MISTGPIHPHVAQQRLNRTPRGLITDRHKANRAGIAAALAHDLKRQLTEAQQTRALDLYAEYRVGGHDRPTATAMVIRKTEYDAGQVRALIADFENICEAG